MRLLERMTWVMIWLMLCIPVATAQQSLTIQKFGGADNVKGFVKEGDELTVQILAEMLGNPTPEVARQRARVFHDETYVFMDSCTAQQNAMQQCTYKTRDIVASGTDDYAVKLYDAENREIASANQTLTVDILAPRIASFGVSPNMTTTAVPTAVTYKVEDYGSEIGKPSDCAGIKSINITANNTPIALIAGNVSTCSKNGTFTFTPKMPGATGKVRVCAVATDFVNHKSAPACRDIFINSQKPTPTALELRDSSGFVITHARTGQTVTADVFVRIADADVQSGSVTADLSKLNPALGRKVRDAQSGEWFIWRSVRITTPQTCQVSVEATDLMGNKDAKTLTCSIGIDDSKPEALALRTQFADDDGTPLLGRNGSIFADLKESGSGLDKANAFLDLRELGLAAEAKAERCDSTGTDTWTCAWNVRPTGASRDAKVKLLPITRDDLDNQLVALLEKTVRFDNTAPGNITLKEIAAFRGQNRVRTNVTTLGEVVEFVVEGSGYSNATADLRDLGGSKDTLPDNCLGNTSKRTCTFGVTVGVSGPQPTNVTFTFSDFAGNKVTLRTTELFILGVSNETNPNYWNASALCSPSTLDRGTLSVFEHPVYCAIKLQSPNKQARPITVQGPLDIGECAGQTEYISALDIQNNFAGSEEPFLALSLVATDYAINNLTFTCPISTLTRVGNYVPQNVEHDNITVKLEFYNLPLGELYDNVDSDIKDAEDSIDGVWDVIGELQKYLGYAESICKILNGIMTLVATLASILAALGLIEIVLSAIPIFGTAAAEAVRNVETSLCNPTDTVKQLYDNDLLKLLKKFCDFVMCQSGLFDLLGVDGGDWSSWNGVSGVTTTDSGAQLTDPNSYLNVKDSLVYSIIVPPLCIPGIIYNLDKWRQIQCRYGTCLLEDVRQNGLPVSVCSDQKHYMECRFVLGEIYNLIPFAGLVNYYLTQFQEALSDPLALAAMGIAYLLNCKEQCNTKPPGIWYNVCAGMAIASQLGQSIKWIQSMQNAQDLFGPIDGTWCEQFEDALDDYEDEKEQNSVLGGGA